jgi:hypothetical protein
MISSVVVLGREEVAVCADFSDHNILVIIIDFVAFRTLSLKIVFHILKSLPLEKDVELSVFNVHYVRVLAKYQYDPIT